MKVVISTQDMDTDVNVIELLFFGVVQGVCIVSQDSYLCT
jgi:hypothetical protein